MKGNACSLIKCVTRYRLLMQPIEPLALTKPDADALGFLLLDGDWRVLALKELRHDMAPCLIAKDFVTLT